MSRTRNYDARSPVKKAHTTDAINWSIKLKLWLSLNFVESDNSYILRARVLQLYKDHSEQGELFNADEFDKVVHYVFKNASNKYIGDDYYYRGIDLRNESSLREPLKDVISSELSAKMPSCLFRTEDYVHLSSDEKAAHKEQVCSWLSEQYEISPQTCIPRQVVYDHYVDFCESHGLQPAPATIFGRMVQHSFKSITNRRLGCRNESRYYYMGMDIVAESEQYQSISKHRLISWDAKPKHSHVCINKSTLKS